MRPLSSFNATGLSAGQLPQHPSPWHSPIPYLFGGLADTHTICICLFHPSDYLKTKKMRPLSSFNATGLSAGQLPQHPSPWHSPIPYLFGGLAAMLGLIAFALLILACSYWKLSGYLGNGGDQNGQLSQESGEGSEKQLESIKVCKELEEQIVVIMAGDQKPTFLANPISSKAPSFTENKEMVVKSCCEEGGEKKRSEEQRSQGGENQ